MLDTILTMTLPTELRSLLDEIGKAGGEYRVYVCVRTYWSLTLVLSVPLAFPGLQNQSLFQALRKAGYSPHGKAYLHAGREISEWRYGFPLPVVAE